MLQPRMPEIGSLCQSEKWMYFLRGKRRAALRFCKPANVDVGDVAMVSEVERNTRWLRHLGCVDR